MRGDPLKRSTGRVGSEDDGLRLFRRQFVVARQRFAFDESWKQAPLPDGWTLSYQEDLQVCFPGEAGSTSVVLGNRYCVDPVTGRGAGRYVEMAWPMLRTDPAALLGVFHARRGSDLAISSSPELAVRALHQEAVPADLTFELQHRKMINYVPAPGSRWSGVRRLLPDQALDLRSGHVVAMQTNINPLSSFDTAVDTMAEALCDFARELKVRVPGRVYLPLTAGLDSRTVAAAFLATGLPFETTTMRFEGKPMADVRIARRISRHFGVRHHVMEPFEPDPAKAALLARHISGTYSDWDLSHLIPGDAYRYQRPGDAMIPGSCFEVGYMYDWIFSDADFESASGEEIWRRCNDTDSADVAGARVIDEWLDWRRAHPGTLSFGGQFYLDQRLAAWRASLEQGYDLLPGVSLTPANHVGVLSALVTPSLEERRARRLQLETIRRLAPELLDFPINPPPLRIRLRGYRRRVTGALRQRWRAMQAAN